MARVILDVPKDKMQPFLKAILAIGISRHSISAEPSSTSSPVIKRIEHLQQISKSLFDWEFYSNELEYE
jgi:hypothetical protein